MNKLEEWVEFKHSKRGFIMLISKEGLPMVLNAGDVKIKIRKGCSLQAFPTAGKNQ